MTVVVNCRFLTQEVTGVQRFAEEITKRLPKLIDGIEFVAPRGELRHVELGGVKIHQFGRLHGHAWEQLELMHYVRERKATLLSLANTGPITVRKQLVVIHDLTWEHFPESYSWQFRVLYHFITRRLIHVARKIVTVSNFSKQDIATHYRIDPKTIAIIPNAVDNKFRTSLGTPPPNVPRGSYYLTVASQAKHKNLTALLSAYLEFSSSINNPPKLVLVGGTSRAFSASHKMSDSCCSAGEVISLGRVEDEELIWLYRHAEAFIFPSLYEGFGIPPVEALVCGCPVISSDAASLPEILGDRVSYFDPTDPNAIESALSEFESSHRTQRIGDVTAQGFSRVITWEDSAVGIVAVLRGKSTRITEDISG